MRLRPVPLSLHHADAHVPADAQQVAGRLRQTAVQTAVEGGAADVGGLRLRGGTAAHVVPSVVFAAQALRGRGAGPYEHWGRRGLAGHAEAAHGAVGIVGLGQHLLAGALASPAQHEQHEEDQCDDCGQDDAHVEQVAERPAHLARTLLMMLVLVVLEGVVSGGGGGCRFFS